MVCEGKLSLLEGVKVRYLLEEQQSTNTCDMNLFSLAWSELVSRNKTLLAFPIEISICLQNTHSS